MKLHQPEPEWYWFLRVERGERMGRVHLHALMRVPFSVLGHFIVPAGKVCSAHQVWGKGLTRFRRIDGAEDPAIPYLLGDDTSLRDAYEMGKTLSVTDGFPSPALCKRAGLQKWAGEINRPYVANEHTGGVQPLPKRAA